MPSQLVDRIIATLIVVLRSTISAVPCYSGSELDAGALSQMANVTVISVGGFLLAGFRRSQMSNALRLAIGIGSLRNALLSHLFMRYVGTVT